MTLLEHILRNTNYNLQNLKQKKLCRIIYSSLNHLEESSGYQYLKCFYKNLPEINKCKKIFEREVCAPAGRWFYEIKKIFQKYFKIGTHT